MTGLTLPYWVPLGPDATLDKLQAEAPEALTADGLDAALVGVGLRDGNLVACYSMERCAQVLIDGGASWDEAWEYLYHNTFCAYVGPHTPFFVGEEGVTNAAA